MCKQKILCSSRKFLVLVARLAGGLAVHLLEQMVNQHAEVARALAKRRNLQDRHGEPVEEVLAKAACGDLLGQRPVGRGDDADVDLEGLRGAEAHDLAFLNRAKQLHLSGAGEFAELVEEERAALGGLEVALARRPWHP